MPASSPIKAPSSWIMVPYASISAVDQSQKAGITSFRYRVARDVNSGDSIGHSTNFIMEGSKYDDDGARSPARFPVGDVRTVWVEGVKVARLSLACLRADRASCSVVIVSHSVTNWHLGVSYSLMGMP